jgi:hypothetical protein
MNTEERNSGHLTAQEISQWLVEGPDQSAIQHVRDCSACEAKMAEAQAPLATFREALVEWSDAQPAPRLHLQTSLTRNEAPSNPRLWLPTVIFAMAVLLMFTYAKVPALLHGKSDARPSIADTSTTTDSDEALLNQVDTEVSEAVPDAMAPLTDLVSWDSSEGSAAQTITAEKHATRKTSTKPANAKAQHDVAN